MSQHTGEFLKRSVKKNAGQEKANKADLKKLLQAQMKHNNTIQGSSQKVLAFYLSLSMLLHLCDVSLDLVFSIVFRRFLHFA